MYVHAHLYIHSPMSSAARTASTLTAMKTANLGPAVEAVRLADNLASVVTRPSHRGPGSPRCRRTYPLSPNRINAVIRERRTMARRAFRGYSQTSLLLPVWSNGG